MPLLAGWIAGGWQWTRGVGGGGQDGDDKTTRTRTTQWQQGQGPWWHVQGCRDNNDKDQKMRKRMVRMRDDNGRDGTNDGTMVWMRTRGKGQQNKSTTMTDGRPDAQDDPSAHHCELLLVEWIAGGPWQTSAWQWQAWWPPAPAPATVSNCLQGGSGC